MSNNASTADTSIPFSFFTELVQAIGAVKPRKVSDNKNATYSAFPVLQKFRKWVVELNRRHGPLPPDTTPIVFRLLFPEEDVRRKYSMQETRLAQYLADILGVSTKPHGRGARLSKWNGEDTLGCLGNEVESIMAASSTVTESTISMRKVDTLLTELAATCAFSGPTVRGTHTNATKPRSKRAILRALYSSLSPTAASVVTQIILKDLRPLLYPIPEDSTHYTAALLQYNSNAITMLYKEATMNVWDASGYMLRAFRHRASLEEAAEAYEVFCSTSGEEVAVPEPKVGIAIQIPKCVKGQGCAHALQQLAGANDVWAETKYDGERAQIHIELLKDGTPRITIFSKSGRDSTLDRHGIHSIIQDALGLPHSGADETRGASSSSRRPAFKRGIILEAEMVAFSDTLDRIDEFWRIRSLIASTAVGVRHTHVPEPPEELYDPDDSASESEKSFNSQYSMESDASDGGTRHLALVFFDVLLLDGTSLLSMSYIKRRQILESVVRIIPGYTMLAERKHIKGPNPERELINIFSEAIADHQEGVVLKAENGRYNEGQLPWVKLKKDYISGYGDTLDLVLIGASWEKDRARELRVPPTTFTTFYLGALANDDMLKQKPTHLPHFQVFFVVSYGLTREKLEELNFMIRASDPVECTPGRHHSEHKPISGLSYSYDLFEGLRPPSVFLRQPLLAEIFGASFTKAPRGRYYEIRFPRISKVFRYSERSWTEGTTLQEFQKIAREAVGRDRSGKAIYDWCSEIFGVPLSPGVKCPEKRKRTEEEWIHKLEMIDQKERSKKRLKTGTGPRTQVHTGMHAHKSGDVENFGTGNDLLKSPPHLMRALGSTTNFTERLALRSQTAPSLNELPLGEESHREMSSALLSPPTSSPQRPHRLAPAIELLDSVSSAMPVVRRSHSNQLVDSLRDEEEDLLQPGAEHRQDAIEAGSILKDLDFAATPMGEFLRCAAVWFAQPCDSPRQSGRVPSRLIIPTGQKLHALDAFLLACGWGESSCDWAEKGVIFVDDTQSGSANQQWEEHPLQILFDLRTSLLKEGKSAQCRPVWIFSIKMLNYDELARVMDDIESRAICRLG